MEPPECLLLGLDIGTTRIKAVAVDGAGAERAAASVATPFSTSPAGVEMEVAALGRAVAEVIAALGPARERVCAVGVAGMAESGAPLRAGEPIGPVIAWHDGRGEETVASLERRFGPALAHRTGRRVRTVSSVAKLGWLLDQGLPEPDRWLGVPELVLFLLTGAEVTEYSLAARTGAYDVVGRCFLPEVLGHVLGGNGSRGGRWEAGDGGGAAGGGLFPPVVAAGSLMGLVSGEAATFGLPVGIPVTIAGHDHLAAAAGLGARPDDLLNSVGTAETLLRRLDTVPDVERAIGFDLAVTVWPGGEGWGVLAGCVRSGLVVQALTEHLGLEPGALDRLAGAVVENPGGHAGAGLPAGSEAKAAARVALPQEIEMEAGTPAEMWTATLRELARRTAAAADRVARLTGPSGRLVVYGGGSRSPTWLRIKAAELRVPVVGSPVADAAARGAALAAGVAAGWWSDVLAGPPPPIEGED